MKGKLLSLVQICLLISATTIGAGFVWLSLPSSDVKTLSVQTGSMRPTIQPGSLVFVRRVPVSDLRVGDVITYSSVRNPKETITHRLIAINNAPNSRRTFIVKGDANQVADRPLTNRQIIGKVTRHVPHLGRVTDFLRKPIGLLLLVYLPALMVVISEMKRLIKHYRDERPYIAAEIEARFKSLRPRHSALPSGGKIGLLLAFVMLVAAAPLAKAAIYSSATVSGNVVSVAPKPVAITLPTPGPAPSPTPAPLTPPSPSLVPTPNPAPVQNPLPTTPPTPGSVPSPVPAPTPMPAPVPSPTPVPSPAPSPAPQPSVATAGNVVIRRVALRCSGDISSTAAFKPRIVLFNPTGAPISIAGWTLQDNNGTFVTVPAQTSLAGGDVYVIKPFIRNDRTANGLQYAGDHVVLVNDRNVRVDGVSWGTDTSVFINPLAVPQPGTRLQRKAPKIDTNLAADFIPQQHVCVKNVQDTDESQNVPNTTEPNRVGDCTYKTDREPRSADE